MSHDYLEALAARYRDLVDPEADKLEVEVWDYRNQEFVRSWRCPGERRVRVDYFGNLDDLALFEVTREDDTFKAIDGNKPLARWLIDLT